jgi:hypothetical protein
MAIEHARTHAVTKPWGVKDLRPWSDAGGDGDAIGEILYERTCNGAAIPALLLKLLFTSQPLSIQVHPDDAFAHAMGLANGKAEAWYVLTASPDAKVALGLSQRLTPQQLRKAIDDDSIADLIVWHAVSANDVIFVPGRTRPYRQFIVYKDTHEGGATKRKQQNETTSGKVPFDLASEAASPRDLFHIGSSVYAGCGLSETYDRERS